MESDGLTNEQTEKVLQFQDLSGIDDINVCRDVLIRHQWDLEVAIQEQLNIREGRPSMYATESQAPQVVNDRFLQHVFQNNRGPPSGFGGFIEYIFNYIFNFVYNTTASTIAAVVNLFRNPEQITDPLNDVLTFINNYTNKYRLHPVFYQGTYAQALNDAKRELRFLLVFLHSESSTESANFCRNTLSDPNVTTYINRNMLFWGCDSASGEGRKVVQSISARTFPALVIVALRANKMIIMGRMEGTCPPEELLRRLKTVVDDNTVWLNQARAERLERSYTQTLRQQQDEAYEQSLRADQEKERLKQMEREVEKKKQRALDDAKMAEIQRKEDLAQLKIAKLTEIPAEPSSDCPEGISIVFKLPTGARLERRFMCTNSLQDVYNFIFCHPLSPNHFEITTNFPKRVLLSSAHSAATYCSSSLTQAGLRNREVLFINDLEA